MVNRGIRQVEVLHSKKKVQTLKESNSHSALKNTDKFYRCGKPGHLKSECRNKSTGRN